MGATVFANGMSIACKVASGKTIAAMPDVCLSPPSPPAGPLPIPYPNTATASDTDKGSKTVQIGGEEVMLKNKSTFKTSTGNEAATKSLGMGVVTHQIQGEASFISWSMDVKFEGENVPRHLDLMGHNEACEPSETPPWPYADSAALAPGGACAGVPEDPCKLVPYDKGCPANKSGVDRTPHHLVPAHCFHPPGYASISAELQREAYNGLDYQHSKAPCVCVTGKDKNATGSEHQLMHNIFDPKEAGHMTGSVAGTWTYAEARTAAVETMENVLPQCPAACTEHQLNQYHEKVGCDDATELRADPAGQGGDVSLPRYRVELIHNL